MEAPELLKLPLVDSGLGKEPRRIGTIDSLRGWAVFFVTAFHISMFFKPSEAIYKFLENGMRGVQLFYLMSAFSLFLSFQTRSKEKPFELGAFFTRRFFRIAPMYWVALLVYLHEYGIAPRFWAPNGLTSLDILLNFSLLHGLWPTAVNSIVPGGWSVGVEWLFYLILPLIFFGIRSFRWAMALVLLSLPFSYHLMEFLYSALKNHYPPDQAHISGSYAYSFSLFSQLPVFCLGVLLFFAVKRAGQFSRMVACLSIALSVLVFYIAWGSFQTNMFSSPTLFGIAFFFFSFGLLGSRFSLFDNRFFQYLGKISFSIYLLNFYAIARVDWLFHTRLLHRISPASKLGYLVGGSLVFALLIGISSFSYHFIEAPGIRLGRRIADKLLLSERTPEIVLS